MLLSGSRRSRIAVIGAGISGLGAAWALAREHDVVLFDGNTYCGGHANTAEVFVDGRPLAVDTGFIVYNTDNYPNLVALFNFLDVPTAASDMSFGVSLDGGRLEYSGSTLRSLFAQRRNLARPRFWRMLRDIRRFYREAPAYLEDEATEVSLGQLLEKRGYGAAFADDHLIPMAAAIWSASRDDIRAHPADAFIRFFMNHGLLSLTDRPQWRTVVGGSREYVRRLLDDTNAGRETGTRVAGVRRRGEHVVVRRADGPSETFDDVVIATHADEALALLEDPTTDERSILSAFTYGANRAFLHEDDTLMPRRRGAWSSWNYIQTPDSRDGEPLSVTYWMNRLQPLATQRNLFVTLNPPRPPRADLVHGVYDYTHPVFTRASASARERMHLIQGRRGTWYCGAYWGSGFHEDGLQSGLWVAERLGASRPWAHAGAFDRIPEIPAKPARAA